jgi:hypothetical protein
VHQLAVVGGRVGGRVVMDAPRGGWMGGGGDLPCCGDMWVGGWLGIRRVEAVCACAVAVWMCIHSMKGSSDGGSGSGGGRCCRDDWS